MDRQDASQTVFCSAYAVWKLEEEKFALLLQLSEENQDRVLLDKIVECSLKNVAESLVVSLIKIVIDNAKVHYQDNAQWKLLYDMQLVEKLCKKQLQIDAELIDNILPFVLSLCHSDNLRMCCFSIATSITNYFVCNNQSKESFVVKLEQILLKSIQKNLEQQPNITKPQLLLIQLPYSIACQLIKALILQAIECLEIEILKRQKWSQLLFIKLDICATLMNSMTVLIDHEDQCIAKNKQQSKPLSKQTTSTVSKDLVSMRRQETGDTKSMQHDMNDLLQQLLTKIVKVSNAFFENADEVLHRQGTVKLLTIATLCPPMIWDLESQQLSVLGEIAWKLFASTSHAERKISHDYLKCLTTTQKKGGSAAWNRYWAIVDTINSYGHQLLSSVWMSSFPHLIATATPPPRSAAAGSRISVRERIATFDWNAVRQLVSLGLNCDSPVVVKFVIDQLLSQSHFVFYPDHSPLLLENKWCPIDVDQFFFVLLPKCLSYLMEDGSNRQSLIHFISNFMMKEKDDKRLVCMRSKLFKLMLERHHLCMEVLIESLFHLRSVKITDREFQILIELNSIINKELAYDVRLPLIIQLMNFIKLNQLEYGMMIDDRYPHFCSLFSSYVFPISKLHLSSATFKNLFCEIVDQIDETKNKSRNNLAIGQLVTKSFDMTLSNQKSNSGQMPKFIGFLLTLLGDNITINYIWDFFRKNLLDVFIKEMDLKFLFYFNEMTAFDSIPKLPQWNGIESELIQRLQSGVQQSSSTNNNNNNLMSNGLALIDEISIVSRTIRIISTTTQNNSLKYSAVNALISLIPNEDEIMRKNNVLLTTASAIIALSSFDSIVLNNISLNQIHSILLINDKIFRYQIGKFKDEYHPFHSIHQLAEIFNTSKWRVMGQIQLDHIFKRQHEEDIQNNDNNENPLMISDPFNLSIWFIEQISIEPLASLPNLIIFLNNTILGQLLESSQSLNTKSQVLRIVFQQIRHILNDFSNKAIGGKLKYLEMFATHLLGNELIIQTDMEIVSAGDSSEIVKCLEFVFRLGQKTVKMIRVFFVPFLLALRNVLKVTSTSLLMNHFACLISKLLIFREPTIEGSQRLASLFEKTTDSKVDQLEIDQIDQKCQSMIYTSAYIRICSLSFLEWLTTNYKLNQNVILSLTKLLLSEILHKLSEIRIEGLGMPPLPNTASHMCQIRLWQALCCFSTKLDCLTAILSQNFDLFDQAWMCLNSICLPDIRHLMEVFFCRLSWSFPSQCTVHLIKDLKNFNAPAQHTASLLVIAGNLLQFLITSEACSSRAPPHETITSLINACLPLSSSNNALIRGVTQFIFVDLADGIEDTELSARLNNDSGFKAIVKFASENHEAVKMRKKMKEKFLSWDISKQQSLHWLLPDRSSDLQTNWRDGICEFNGSDIRMSKTLVLSLRNAITTVLSEQPYYVITTETEDDLNDFEKNITPDHQRKFQPWMNSTKKLNTSKKRTNLIIVASLLIKIPNIAGVVRSGEIFNAESILISNKNLLKDPLFLSCSVTSHLWIPIQEVAPALLSFELLKLKQKGYTIVALEQTNNSIFLDEFQFPLKSVLVLGNEKEGIPPLILDLVDVCCEIPQQGVIRSLNVHVSGSLALWEYTKQHTRGS